MSINIMSRLQLALNVSNLEESIAFYTKLFGVKPAKVKPGYANFAIDNPPLKLILEEGEQPGGTINHLGVEVVDTAEVERLESNLKAQGLTTKWQKEITCCYAEQDKFWVADPDEAPWEIYTVLKDTVNYGENARPELTAASSSDSCCD